MSANFYVLDVGQGMGHFLEYRDHTGLITNTVLIDFGSTHVKKLAGGPSVELVEESLRRMNQPTIDVLFISHSDRDHHNLLNDLLKKFPDKDELDINRVIFGGSRDNYTSGILKKLEEYIPGGGMAEGFSGYETSFTGAPRDGVTPFVPIGDDIKIYLVLGNLLSMEGNQPKGRTGKLSVGYDLNTVSLVLLLVVHGAGFLIPGDATGHTIAGCNSMLDGWADRPYFNNVVMATAPHHASASTTYDIRGIDGITPDENVETFVATFGAGSIVASAEREESKLKHPSFRVLKAFWEWLDPNPMWWEEGIKGNYHIYTAYVQPNEILAFGPEQKTTFKWPSNPFYYSFFTRANIYTTLYAQARVPGGVRWPPDAVPPEPMEDGPEYGDLPRPPTGTTWLYGVGSNGAVTLSRVDNRELLDAGLLERLAMPPVPCVPIAAGGPRRVRVFP